jgi:hypothetical protein
MKKIIIFTIFCLGLIFFSCQREKIGDREMNTKSGGGGTGPITPPPVDTLGGGDSSTEVFDCISQFVANENSGGSYATLQSFQQCVSADPLIWKWANSSGYVDPLSSVSYPNGMLPYLLGILGLNESSTSTEIGAVHDSLQKYNAIILSAVAARSDWLALDNYNKQIAILLHYYETDYVSNPLSDEELTFFTNYIGLLFYIGVPSLGQVMIVSHYWAYELFYDNHQPIGGDYVGVMDNINGFLAATGVPTGPVPLMFSKPGGNPFIIPPID